MLEGLDKIDWHNLTHAYGSASDIPAVLRSLANNDNEDSETTLGTLFSTIWHQGTVYDSTAYAVPFLIELLQYPDVPDKADILNLFELTATGSGYLEVHGEGDFYRKERGTPEFQAKLSREYEIAHAAYNAVTAGAHVYVALLQHETPFVRQIAASVLRLCTPQRETVLPRLREHFDTETNPDVKTELLRSWVMIQLQDGFRPTTTAPLAPALFEFLTGVMRSTAEPDSVRLKAATLLLQHSDADLLDEVLALFHRVIQTHAQQPPPADWADTYRIIFTLQEALEHHPRPLLQWLIQYSDFPAFEVRRTILDAIESVCSGWRWAPPLAVPTIAAMLDDLEMRLYAAAGLSRMGSAAKAAEEKLRVAAQDPNKVTRKWAAKALASIHRQASFQDPIEPAKGRLSALINLLEEALALNHHVDQELQAIIAALAKKGKNNPQVTLLLQKALDHQSPFVRIEAAKALWTINGPAAAPVILPTLLEALEPYPYAVLAMECLADIGKFADAVVPKLRQIAESERRFTYEIEIDEHLQATAHRTLQRIK